MMSGFSEGKTTLGLWLCGSALCAAWIAVLARGLDGAAVLFLIVSWHLSRRDQEQTPLVLSGILLVTGLGAGMIDWIWGWTLAAVMILAGILLPRPVRRTDLEGATLFSLVLIGMMTVFGQVRHISPAVLASPAVIMAGWWMILRLVTSGRGRVLLRKTAIPVWSTALMWLILVLTGHSGVAAQRHAQQLVRRATVSETTEEALDILARAAAIYPWSSSLWAGMGGTQQELLEEEDAFDSFRRGYEIQPGKGNPCLWGLSETARLLGKPRLLAELIASRVIPADLSHYRGRFEVAVELWRTDHLGDALEVLGSRDGLSEKESEMAGWIRHAMGEDSMAVAALEAIVAMGNPSGETVSRLASSYRRLGRTEECGEILSRWGPLFPDHLSLARVRNVPVPEPCGERFNREGLVLGNTVCLLGWDATPHRAVVGDTLTIRTCWVATKPLRDMRVILHLDVGSPTRYRLNQDHAPLGGARPTSQWPVGELVTDVARVPLPADAPVGAYRIFTGLWVPGDEQSRLWPGRAQADLIPRGEKRIPLGTIEVEPN